jgi:hypothetical protein
MKEKIRKKKNAMNLLVRVPMNFLFDFSRAMRGRWPTRPQHMQNRLS